MEPQHVGYVIGKEGKTLRSVEAEFGVRRLHLLKLPRHPFFCRMQFDRYKPLLRIKGDSARDAKAKESHN